MKKRGKKTILAKGSKHAAPAKRKTPAKATLHSRLRTEGGEKKGKVMGSKGKELVGTLTLIMKKKEKTTPFTAPSEGGKRRVRGRTS